MNTYDGLLENIQHLYLYGMVTRLYKKVSDKPSLEARIVQKRGRPKNFAPTKV